MKPNPIIIPKWKQRTHDTHQKHLKEYLNKSFKYALLGDSMMERFKYTKYSDSLTDYVNLGVGGDQIQNLLYRISGVNITSILDIIKVEKIFLMIGTNNVEKGKSGDIIEGIIKIIQIIFDKQPNCELIIYGITLRKDVPETKIKEVNEKLELTIKNSNKKISYRTLNVSIDDLIDNVHLNDNGYEKWFNNLII